MSTTSWLRFSTTRSERGESKLARRFAGGEQQRGGIEFLSLYCLMVNIKSSINLVKAHLLEEVFSAFFKYLFHAVELKPRSEDDVADFNIFCSNQFGSGN